jgi:hypothetical protein
MTRAIKLDMANTKQAARWVKMARETAKKQMGSTVSLLTSEIRDPRRFE